VLRELILRGGDGGGGLLERRGGLQLDRLGALDGRGGGGVAAGELARAAQIGLGALVRRLGGGARGLRLLDLDAGGGGVELDEHVALLHRRADVHVEALDPA
jgi:hypothetical protein